MKGDYTGYLIFGGIGVGLYLLYDHLKKTCQPSDSTGLCSMYNSIFGGSVRSSLTLPAEVMDPAVLAADIATMRAEGKSDATIQALLTLMSEAYKNCTPSKGTWDKANGACMPFGTATPIPSNPPNPVSNVPAHIIPPANPPLATLTSPQALCSQDPTRFWDAYASLCRPRPSANTNNAQAACEQDPNMHWDANSQACISNVAPAGGFADLLVAGMQKQVGRTVGTVSEWNWVLTNLVDSTKAPIVDSSYAFDQQISVEQYLSARSGSGLAGWEWAMDTLNSGIPAHWIHQQRFREGMGWV